MTRYLNIRDVLTIAVSAYVFVWGVNNLLRHVGMADYQA